MQEAGWSEAAVRGLLAGAAGTLALNGLTYLDMVWRGRPASQVPAETAEQLAGSVGVDLGPDPDSKSNRSQGLGALMGYAAGLGVATTYAFFLRRRSRQSLPVGATVLTIAAMVPGNIPAVLAGVTDPNAWTARDWLADVIPHAGYGLTAAATHRWLS
jgi:hypothetical protein